MASDRERTIAILKGCLAFGCLTFATLAVVGACTLARAVAVIAR